MAPAPLGAHPCPVGHEVGGSPRRPSFHVPCGHVSPDAVGTSVTQPHSCLPEHELPITTPRSVALRVSPASAPLPTPPAAGTEARDERLMLEPGTFGRARVHQPLPTGLSAQRGLPRSRMWSTRGLPPTPPSLSLPAHGTGALPDWADTRE